MVIVAGYMLVAAEQRATYLAGARPVGEAARGSEGWLDFSLTADLIDPERIAVLEQWDSRQAPSASARRLPSASMQGKQRRSCQCAESPF